jgi:two-component system CheB/CheR fusion protein
VSNKEDSATEPSRQPVAVIGASAGGLEALTELVAQIESETSVAFVVVQHLSANQKSILHELLQSHCKVPVTQIVDQETIRPGHVYVVPPGTIAEIEGGRLLLSERSSGDVMHRPIDQCFESLARSRGRDGYCIVLSGTGSDGAVGLRAVKEAGGITFAQESETARFPGMPDAAVATGLVDFVLPSSEIVPRVEEIVRHRDLIDDDKIAEARRAEITEALPRITAVLRDALGHDFSDYKPGTMVRRIERRMQVLRQSDLDRFVSTLEEDPDQATDLGQEFLIGVTEFFRDPDAFEALRRKVVEPLLDVDRQTVRVWVPGCSTGEEAYSIAILLAEAMEARRVRRTVQIFGTDIDGHALLTARQGLYPIAAFSKMETSRRERFFQPQDGGLRARADIRECCVFAPHNVVQDPPFSRLDLVSCRNLLIYLSADLQRRVLPRFHFSLRDPGFLFLGPSERLSGDTDLFRAIDKTNRIFQRDEKAKTHYSSLRDAVPRPGTTHVPRQLGAVSQETGPVVSREVIAEREYLRRHAAPFAVVSSSGEVRYLSRAMTAFSQVSEGVPSNQIDALLVPALRVPVRAALSACAETGEDQSIECVMVRFDDAERPRMFDVSVSPIRPPGEDFLVSLSEVRTIDAQEIGAAADRRENADQALLENENVRLGRQLHATLQEYETSGQELKSTNEELMSMNEELQSSNEELETAREELQSINEELETVNSELRENNRQLVRANSDLANLLESTDIAVLFLDRSFAVRNFTPATTALYAIKPRDIGRPIFDLRSRVSYPEFHEDAKNVDATLQPIEREVRIDETDETFLMRIKPYRTTDNRIDGYVLSFVDITLRKRNEEALDRQRQDLARQYAELENLYDTTPVGLALVDPDLRYLRINDTLAAIDGHPVDAYEGHSIDEMMPQVAEVVRPLYERVFETGEAVLGHEIQAKLRETGEATRHFIADFYPVRLGDEVYAVGLCVREVTEQKRLMNDLAASEARLQGIFDVTPVFIVITSGPDHEIVYSNPANTALAGNREMLGRTLAEAFPELPEQNLFQRFDDAYRTGERQSYPEFPYRFDREGDGALAEAWFSQVVEPMRDGSGEVIGTVSFAYEITEQVQARQSAERSEAQKTLLLAELQHRVKNSLATVRAISRFLLAGSSDAATFHERLSLRLGAMARTHDLLTDADWVSARLSDIVAAEAAPYEKDDRSRIRVSGDELVLGAKEAMAFGMAVHELMTNAVKYGALSNDAGHVEVDVAVGDGGEGSRRVTWRELDGPPVRDPGDRRGFGSVVVERVLASDVGAEIDIRFDPDGLVFEAVF